MLTVLKKMISVYSENYMKPTYRYEMQFWIAEAGGTAHKNYHWKLKVSQNSRRIFSL
jgi:hypothetical protein